MKNQKATLLFIVFISHAISSSAHNLITNKLQLRFTDSVVFVQAKGMAVGSNSIIEMRDSSLPLIRSQFGQMQLFEGEWPVKNLPIEITIDNGAPTSVEVLSNQSSVQFIERTASILVSNNLKLMPENENLKPSYLMLGIEHIVIGFDHLLFILALLFLVKPNAILWMITSFTLAHSITLSASVLGWLTPGFIGLSGIWVEGMIAGSIVLLALEMRKNKNVSPIKTAGIVFVFGLLHGFGFASVLLELGLPATEQWKALFSFNLGVEIGQLLFIGVLLFVFKLIKPYLSKEKLVNPISMAIGGVAVFWFIERTAILSNTI